MNEEIKKAVEILNAGGIVIFPTDTAFGIGCRIDKVEAIKKLFEIRKRPLDMAVPVLIGSIEMAKSYIKPVPRDVKDLMNKYWPGALTIIFSCKTENVPSLVRGGGSTLGLRIPNNSIIQEIIKGVGAPILGPSANFHKEKTPYKLDEINQNLIQKVDFVVQGKTSTRNVSTVIDITKSPWKILREGAIKIESSELRIQNGITLIIDTTSSEEVEVGLIINSKEFTKRKRMDSKKREIVLALIEHILKTQGLKLNDLDGIEVNPGPGSFTGIRVGISIANALGLALKIPVNGKIGGEVNPVYN